MAHAALPNPTAFGEASAMTNGSAVPRYTPAERRADALVHWVGIGFAALAAPALIWIAAQRGDGATLAAVTVYATTLVAMLSISACYHMLRLPQWREVLRRLDHGAIYLKIAGTYTPFAAISIGGTTGRSLLLGVWTVAAIGCAVKVAAPRRFEIASIALYLALGWAVLFVAGEAVAALPAPTLALMATGGALYSLGVVFHLWDSLPYQNAIWHLHVLIATICFYAAVMLMVIE
jgi:hemolysin III